MSTSMETGHARNVAAFEELITICTSFANAYNPGKNSLQLAGLLALLEALKDVMGLIRVNQTAYNNAINSRAILFRQLKTLAAQIVNTLDAHGATPETMEDARLLLVKIRGRRISPRAGETPDTDPNAKTIKTISASQTSYDNLLEHFSRLVTLAMSEPTYKPNELSLNNAGLQAKQKEYEQANKKVVDTRTTLGETRIQRNKLLYDPLDGAVAIAAAVKKYVKSLFGLSSPQYKQLSSLQFRIPKL